MSSNNDPSTSPPAAVGPAPAELADWVVRVARHADEKAFESLYTHFEPRLKKYMMRLGTSPDAAEDLAQEAMANLWRRASSYNPETAAVSTWVFTIARNLRIDRLRRSRFVEVPLPEDYADSWAAEDDHESRLDGGKLMELMAALAPEQREVMHLVYREGLSHTEISDRLDLPLGTVKSRLRRAIAHLRERSGGEA